MDRIDIALRVVEVVPGARISARSPRSGISPVFAEADVGRSQSKDKPYGFPHSWQQELMKTLFALQPTGAA